MKRAVGLLIIAGLTGLMTGCAAKYTMGEIMFRPGYVFMKQSDSPATYLIHPISKTYLEAAKRDLGCDRAICIERNLIVVEVEVYPR